MKLPVVFLLALVACESPASGTFVGNPTLVARYLDDSVHQGAGGRLITASMAMEPCGAPTIGVGAQTFDFVGTEASVQIELPDVELCGIRMAVLDLAISVDHAGTQKTVVGEDFDLVVGGAMIPSGQSFLELRLGDEDWLSSFVPLAAEGETRLNAEAPEALTDAFFDGLNDGSVFEAIPSR